MPTADATLLPPPFSSSSSFEDEPHSARSLEAVGVETVLGAMIEQRRASQPSFASVVVPAPQGVLAPSDDVDDDHAQGVPTASEVFLKAR